MNFKQLKEYVSRLEESKHDVSEVKFRVIVDCGTNYKLLSNLIELKHEAELEEDNNNDNGK